MLDVRLKSPQGRPEQVVASRRAGSKHHVDVTQVMSELR